MSFAKKLANPQDRTASTDKYAGVADRRLDNLLVWRVLEGIAAKGSLTGACIELDLDVSTVSRQIAALEREWRVTLLNRSTKPAGLSHFVMQNLPLVRRMLNLVGELECALADESASEEKTVIRMSLSTSTLVHNVMGFLDEYATRRRNVVFELRPDLSHDAVLRKEIDVALIPYMPSDRELNIHPVGQCANLLLASPAYLARVGTPERVEDLVHHTLLLKRKDRYPEAESLYCGSEVFDLITLDHYRHDDELGAVLISRGRDGAKIEKRYFGDQGSYVAALDGLGIAVDLPLSFVETALLERRLVPVLAGWHRAPWRRNLVSHRDSIDNAELQAFIAWFQKREGEDSCNRWMRLYERMGVPAACVRNIL